MGLDYRAVPTTRYTDAENMTLSFDLVDHILWYFDKSAKNLFWYHLILSDPSEKLNGTGTTFNSYIAIGLDSSYDSFIL